MPLISITKANILAERFDIGFIVVRVSCLSIMNLLGESIAEASTTLLDREKVEVDMLKAHNALLLARISSKDRVFIFDKLRRKIKAAAAAVEAKQIKNINDDMKEVGAVREQAEGLYGKFAPPEEEGQQQVRSSQLSFLIGARLDITSSSDGSEARITLAPVSPAQLPVVSGVVIDSQTDTLEPPST